MHWLIPSFYGDIELSKHSDGTELSWFKLTLIEREALVSLARSLNTGAFAAAGIQGEVVAPEGRVVICASLELVEAELTRLLKGDATVLRVIRTSTGNVVPVDDCETDKGVPAPKDPAKGEATHGTSVRAPAAGCPQPVFEKVFDRATRVLKTFCTPQQIRDWDSRQQIVVRGKDTGHSYLVTSRSSGSTYDRFGHVYDSTLKQTLCYHDWALPAPEEVLSLKLWLEHKESHLLSLHH